ncbi:hypothetical protein [Deinococcus hopiensis]|uniref:Lipoprotein n=1 Tax=Deinococcus hopiensis KR-140 TaxID=695939 RepID=A0A1W1VJC4_9DEIO|nr:hypothetical protein [Deinococcus hopiensis]SMB93462.1 hypothetical protein SAMN00790413_01995 [Deinococcus hopiensis KR-140]
MNAPARFFIVASLGLLLSACAGRPTLQVGPAAPAKTVGNVQGNISRWGGAGKVTLAGLPGQALAQADVASSGLFILPLPDAVTVQPALRPAADALSAVGCTGRVTSSDDAARNFAFINLQPQRSEAKPVFAARLQRTSFTRAVLTGRVYLYADRPTRLSGQVDCGQIMQEFAGVAIGVPISVNVNAQSGWNALELRVDVQGSLTGVSATGEVGAVADAPQVWRTAQEIIDQASQL